ncbi:hypothetical protein EHF33_16390 (plasmid) [Deinococcus psychrotolerans]|uniref:Tetratricopeptide repeat protein n=1 Tax=Deinococcus psychrotolerans TaxID=2489213 RepID=A0A3G8YPD7_9DEIO|nr:hypothetical protein [Deinococcus psychrotolerans]AZI44494.1 hypothetical protein EHF33_16390 [Deinococcus psychrotolerans]
MPPILRRPNRLTTAFLIFVLSGPLGLAAPLDDALNALMGGKVDATVNMLRDNTDAPSLVVLARAYVGQSLFVGSMTAKKKLYELSEAAGRRAVTADPRNAEAKTELAYALGLQLQGAGIVEATRTGLEVKRLFDDAVKLDPNTARAWVGLGTWNVQALSLGGLVRFATGASEADMRQDHRKAIQLQPNEVFFRLSYADSLLLLAKNDNRRAAGLKQEARSILQAALNLTPETYWQRYDQEAVRQRLKALGGS